MAPPDTCPADPVLRRLIEDDIDDALAERITDHIDRCARCQQVLDSHMQAANLASGLSSEELAAAEETLPIDAAIEHVKSLRDRTGSVTRETRPSRETIYRDCMPWIEPADDCIGKIDGYRLIEFIGRGGMGVVFKAIEESLDREVAIKLMSPAMLAQPKAHDRFLKAARAAAAVRHGNVVAIHAVSEHDGLPYLVSELIQGSNLQERIDEQGRIEVGEATRIATQLLEGLAEAHARRVSHRDIKPANILLEASTGDIKITDFGLARRTNDVSPKSTTVVGTPAYLAPELLDGKHLPDHRADLYSVGCVLYAMLAGRPPFDAATMIETLTLVAASRPRNLRELRPDVPPALLACVTQLMAKQPGDRPGSASEAIELLQGRETSEAASVNSLSAVNAVIWITVAATCISAAFLAGSWLRSDSTWTTVATAEQLQTALATESDHLRIKIRGAGPFEITGGSLMASKTEIVAEKGSRPLIFLEGHAETDSSLETRGVVRLEGIVLQSTFDHDEEEPPPLILAESGSLEAVDCEFILGAVGDGIEAVESDLSLVDCRVVAPDGSCIVWYPEADSQLRLENSDLIGEAGIEIQPIEPSAVAIRDSRFQTANGLICHSPFDEVCLTTAMVSGTEFDCDSLIYFEFLTEETELEFDDFFDWNGAQNSYPAVFVSVDSDEPYLIESYREWIDTQGVDERETLGSLEQ